MAEEWVEMKHDGIEGVARVTLTSFNKLHKGKGWKLVKPAKAEKKTAKKVKPADE